LVWAGTMFVSFFLGRALTGANSSTQSVSHDASPGVIDEMQRGFQFVRRSPIMQWISYSAILFAVCYYSLALPFSRQVTAQFPNPDQLAGFLGAFQGLYTGTALLASLFLANRAFARFGVMPMLLLFPLIYLAGLGVLALYAPFALLVGVRFVQMAYLNGMAETSWQASFNVVPPELRDQVRAFVNGVPAQAGTFLAGLVLLIGDKTLQPQQLYLVGLAAAAGLAYIVWRASRAYMQALVEALRAGQPQVFFSEERPFGGFQSDAAAIPVLLRGLNDPQAGIRRVSAEILGHVPVPEAVSALIAALQDRDPSVQVEALASLGRAGDPAALQPVAGCLSDPEPEVRLAAIGALSPLAAPGAEIAGYLEPLLSDPELLVRAQAAQVLCCSGDQAQARQTLHALAADASPQVRARALEALGECGDESAFSLTAAALDDALPLVRNAAARGLVAINPGAALPYLVQHLKDEDASVRAALAEALGAIGEPAVEPLLAALSVPAAEDGALAALEGLPLQKAGEKILAYTQAAAQAALCYHRLAQGLVQAYALTASGDGPVQLLEDSLRERAYRSGINALRALGLMTQREAIAAAIENLRSRQASQRANALETLEALGEREIIQPLLSVWESGEAAPPLLPKGWLHDLLDDPDPWLRACAILVSARVEKTGQDEKISQLSRTEEDEFVRALAVNVLTGGAAVDTLATLSTMERIMFLRRVPLFAELSPADLKQVAAIAREVLFTDGQVMARQHELGTEMFLIISGEVRVLMETEGQKGARQVARRGRGECVGEMSIISQEPRIATLVADGQVRTLCISQKQFEGILRERPETGLALLRTLCQRLKEANERVTV
jgi:HEAT repeat protein